KEEIAALILAFSDDNGNIATNLDNNGKYTDNAGNIHNIDATIVDIIPGLRWQETSNVNNYFKNTIYPMALEIFREKFPDVAKGIDNHLSSIDIDNRIENAIKDKDLINKLIIPDPIAKPSPISVLSDEVTAKIHYINENSVKLQLLNYVINLNPISILGYNSDINSQKLEKIFNLCYRNSCSTYFQKIENEYRNCRNDASCIDKVLSNFNIYIVKSTVNQVNRYHVIVDDKFTENKNFVESLLNVVEINNSNYFPIDNSYDLNKLTGRDININNSYGRSKNGNIINDKNSGILEKCKIFGKTIEKKDNKMVTEFKVPFTSSVQINRKDKSNRPIVETLNYYVEDDNTLNRNAIGAKFASNKETSDIVSNINYPRRYKSEIDRNKNNYNHLHINYYSNILCDRTVMDDTKYELNSIQDHIKNIVSERIKKAPQEFSDNKFKEILCMAKSNAIQRMFPVDSDGKALGFVSEKNHINEDNNWFRLINELHIIKHTGVGNRCNFNKVIRKRQESGNQCSINNSKINYNIDVDNALKNIVNLIDTNQNDFGELSNIINDENQIKELYKNPESFEILCEKLSKYFIREMNNYDQNQKKEFILEFNNIINGLKDYLSKSEYNESIGNIKEKNTQKMEKYFNKAYNYYMIENNELLDSEGEELVTKISYNEDSNSNYHNDKLLDILNKLVKIINMDENSGIGVKINQNTFLNEINPRTIASFDGLNNAIDELCKKINEIDNSRINELRNVIDDIEIIKNTIILELYINGEPSINTEMIIKIYNTLNNKIGNTENINIIESQNELKINIYESNNNDIIESLKSNTISIENKKYIFKGLEYNIVNSKESVLNENMIEILMKIKSFIESKKEQIKSYNSLKGHEQEIMVQFLIINH
ncbi:hypothetical protein PIROE2DRAFT_65548, partial [Piromyces sp. E2]